MQFTYFRSTFYNFEKNFENLEVHFVNSYSVALEAKWNRWITMKNELVRIDFGTLKNSSGTFDKTMYQIGNSDIAGKLNIHPENIF